MMQGSLFDSAGVCMCMSIHKVSREITRSDTSSFSFLNFTNTFPFSTGCTFHSNPSKVKSTDDSPRMAVTWGRALFTCKMI